ncbi:hypothetical protein AQUCO_03800145v1 [Aquilegia coerulea]|uniref:Uncharacterized protein n=1 Tax=Aquilegia coerulea TaxID=218851 RepID=A0A2G5CSU5_AQUCA|nr:hypothetical protein AQUCO_03800145v1 [Aquilegia coerulea]
MKNVTDSFVSLGHWPSAGSFGFNTDILATNPINLSVVLENLSTIRNSEELREGAIEKLEKAKARLRKAKMEADEFRVNEYSEIEREKRNLINSSYQNLERLENSKNETIQLNNKERLIKSDNAFFNKPYKEL